MRRISARHILVEQEFEAKDIIRKLDEGKRFEDLAKEFSNCPSANDGGTLGSFGKGQMVKSFEMAAFELEIDEISPIVRTQFGYHLIQRMA